MLKHRGRLLMLSLAVVAVAALTGMFVADEASGSSVTGTSELVGSPEAVACDGAVDVKVTLTGAGGPTDIMLVLDLSGSMTGHQLDRLKIVATQLVKDLDAQLGPENGTLELGNKVGIITYSGSTAVPTKSLSIDASALITAIDALATTSSASPHAAGIDAARIALGAGPGKAIVLISDGLGGDLVADTAAATAAKGAGITIASVGVGAELGGGINEASLTAWASPGSYQNGTTTIDAAKLVNDIDAEPFTLTETPGSKFTLSDPDAGGTIDAGNVKWSGSLGYGKTATLTYTATRNLGVLDLFAITEETVSSSVLTVRGGAGAVAPATRLIEVLPCDADPELFNKVTCGEGSCEGEGDGAGGLKYKVNAGAAGEGTNVLIAGLTSTPPAGVCKGFDTRTSGVQIDLRPLTTPGNFEIFIPNAALGSTRWSKTEVCLGTNLPFRTKTGTNPQTGNVSLLDNGRYWGLLPSSPRQVKITGLGRVIGPWVTSRAQWFDTDGNVLGARISFTVPYIASSGLYTSNSPTPGYDPRAWGG